MSLLMEDDLFGMPVIVGWIECIYILKWMHKYTEELKKARKK